LKKILLNFTLLVFILISIVLFGQKIITINVFRLENSNPDQLANAISTQLISQAIIMILHFMTSIIMVLTVKSKLMLKSVLIIFLTFSILICINGIINIIITVITFIIVFIRVKLFTGAREQNVL
jgi:hypothetical protein